MKFKCMFALAGFLAAASAVSAHHSLTAVQAKDANGAARTTFSSTEKIMLTAVANISVIDSQNLQFIYEVRDPNGTLRLTQIGNSIPGSVGSGGSSLTVDISRFFSVPGMYTMTAIARAPSTSVAPGDATATTTFLITSPVITLTYPPNGAMDIADSPIVFRWAATGAAKYRLTVAQDAAFFQGASSFETLATEYTYPTEPPDTRQRLQAGTVYYWKVEGLNSDNSIAATSAFAQTFTVKAQAAPPSARDIAIVGIQQDITETTKVKIDVLVKNQGGKAESSIQINLFYPSASGPLNYIIASIASGETQTVSFYPTGYLSGNVFFFASCDFFDDNNRNNVLSMQLNITGAASAKILGKVDEVGEPSGIEGVAVTIKGSNVSQAVKTGGGGQYKFEGLAPGDYTVEVLSPADFEQSQPQNVSCPQAQAYPNIDFHLKPKLKPADQALKDAVAAMPPALAQEFNGYDIVSMSVAGGGEPAGILYLISKGRGKINSFKVEPLP